MRFLLLFLLSLPAHANSVTCLASTIFHESRGEPERARIHIVVNPTLNRAADNLLGGYAAPGSRVLTSKLDVCKVIHAKGQYSWKGLKYDEESLTLAKSLLSKKFYTVGSRRFFNNKTLGIRYKTGVKPITIASMVAY